MTNSVDTLLRAGDVYRYHTRRTNRMQDVAAHTWGALVILYALTGQNPTPAAVRALLYHDTAELYTGDTPAPAKRRWQGLDESLHRAEVEARTMLGVPPNDELSYEEALLLRLSDCFEACFFAIRELKSGNSIFASVFNNAYEAALSRVTESGDVLKPYAPRILTMLKHLEHTFNALLGANENDSK